MTLTGKKIAFLLTDGVEQIELTSPWEAVQDAGGSPTLVSPAGDSLQGFNGTSPGDTFTVDASPQSVEAEDFDALVLPGGVVNADHLRMDEASVNLVRAFFEQHKPVAAICHGPWLLAEAGVLGGRTVTSYPSLRTDLSNAGAEWVDEEVVVDNGLVTSRNPDDLPAFNAKLVEEVNEGTHAGQTT
ncbi:type 1 glutamine amidotransferase domain-containing protein [Salinibacterium sedimenticola]|uniref:type 1 glutamine amidotransferase domain-containing protein n=1 Tax=Homoserinimonas sedimenticola TaxID=2986805 RepID=UPI00355736EF